MTRYIDAHCHLPLRPVPDGCAIIVNAITEDDWAAIIDAAHQSDSVYGAIGIHPWYCGTVRNGWNAHMTDALRDNPNIMVGEIGLDTGHPDIELQRDIFTQQLKIANDFGRAAYIHWIGAWDILPGLLSGGKAPVIMHSFAGSGEVMQTLLQKCDAYFSFGPAILDTRRERMRRALVMAPADKILVETDTNGDVNISDIISEIATIRGTAILEMSTTIYHNSQKVLRNGQTA